LSDLDKKMKQILAMLKTEPNCAIHGAPADGFSKVDCFFDFAGPFGSAFFLCHPERSEGSKAV